MPRVVTDHKAIKPVQDKIMAGRIGQWIIDGGKLFVTGFVIGAVGLYVLLAVVSQQ